MRVLALCTLTATVIVLSWRGDMWRLLSWRLSANAPDLISHNFCPKVLPSGFFCSGPESSFQPVLCIAYSVLHIPYFVKHNIISVIFNDTVQCNISRGLAETMIMALFWTYMLNNSGKNPTGFQNLSGSLNAPIFWEDTSELLVTTLGLGTN